MTNSIHSSWVDSANGHSDFPHQNLSFGIFIPPGLPPRGGVAIGDEILDLSVVCEPGLLSGEALQAARVASGTSLSACFALGSGSRRSLRAAIMEILSANNRQITDLHSASPLLHYKQRDCEMSLPAHIGDYTDFYCHERRETFSP